MSIPYICASCRSKLSRPTRAHRATAPFSRPFSRPSFAPKPILDLKHIRQNPGLYEQNARDRNYLDQSKNSWRILELHEQVAAKQKDSLDLRRKNNALGKEIQRQAGMGDDGQGGGKGGVSALVEEARKLKEDLQLFEKWENAVRGEMEALALGIPNLSSDSTPVGDDAKTIGFVNGEPPKRGSGKSHVDIGRELDIIDFEASATTSGWGWYFLKNEGALLEQALVQYALAVAVKRGWQVMTPPSLVYGHIASACGFLPRDQNGETQVYQIAAHDEPIKHDGEGKPGLVLAGTAEIPFAASQANKTLQADKLPLKVIGPSRSYRAEAGARGVDTKGLYRVHEFTKVEMFAWTTPPASLATDAGDRFGAMDEADDQSQTDAVFEEILDIQTEILTSLGLHAKILEMPSTDLGASAARKVDIEAFFPSRAALNDGYGELTSASICTDYQSRRLSTRLKSASGDGKLSFPYTLNGTAMAVPRVLACLLENHWDDKSRTVKVPDCLRPFMLGGIERIGNGS